MGAVLTRMNHSEEFGRASWAGAEMPVSWRGTTAAGHEKWKSMIDLSPPVRGQAPSSTWMTTNQRVYQADPVFERARNLCDMRRELEFQKKLKAISDSYNK